MIYIIVMLVLLFAGWVAMGLIAPYIDTMDWESSTSYFGFYFLSGHYILGIGVMLGKRTYVYYIRRR